MNGIGRVDAFQRRHRVVGYPIAVVYKYFDDQGPYLAAIIAYYSFIAIFPILLISTSVLGFLLQGDPGLSDRLLDTALSQFPIVGDQLGRPEGLTGSTGAIVVGSLAALYGALGLGQSTQNAANIAWSVPRNSRANPFLMRLKSLILLATAGVGILVIAVGSSVLANAQSINETFSDEINLALRIVGFVLSVGIFWALFRLVSAGRGRWPYLLAGAAVTAGLWQLLQWAGQAYVSNVINTASSMNGTFALVLGLIAFIYVAALMVVVGLEVAVVSSRRLFPRALLTPFTDNVVLTEADQRAYTAYAKSQRHKGFQVVEVRFDEVDAPTEVIARDDQPPSA
ncbi:YihY/virulence factor BrkB family protein [Aeromicrobium marinum]|uniref:YihY/virulence factor BrkB family protein n=1 Tax=Aeromicrobium marinum TaxID=219314 RepID=UPI00145DE960|nr:YihY/virulence factor BrkB family protein [Aeromicrobium marinum]